MVTLKLNPATGLFYKIQVYSHYLSNLRFCGRNFLHYCRWWWGLRNTLPDTRVFGRSLPCCWWISCRCCWYSRHMNSDHDSDHHFLMPKQRLSPVPSCPVKHKWTYFVKCVIGDILKRLFTIHLLQEYSLGAIWALRLKGTMVIMAAEIKFHKIKIR